MGQILQAICRNSKCRFKETVYFGGGITDFTTVCSVPAIDRSTNKFLVENYLQEDTLPSHIIFYTSPDLQSESDNQDWHQWCEVSLKPKNNYCPECGYYTLDFLDVGCWD